MGAVLTPLFWVSFINVELGFAVFHVLARRRQSIFYQIYHPEWMLVPSILISILCL